MQCKDVELVLEQEGLEPLSEEARAHLAHCLDCRNYVADLTSLVDAAKKLPREITPPDRVWVALRAQLEAEGIIKPQPDPVVAASASWWESIAAFFSSRSTAVAMVAILLVAGTVFVVRSQRTGQIATTTTTTKAPSVAVSRPAPPPNPAVAAKSTQPPDEFAGAARALDDQEPLATGMLLASSSPVDVSMRDNLKKVDEFIAECERHLKAQPNDELTREYLSAAYQQKADLLSAIIERGRSVN